MFNVLSKQPYRVRPFVTGALANDIVVIPEYATNEESHVTVTLLQSKQFVKKKPNVSVRIHRATDCRGLDVSH